jgi:polyphenol oxidase
MGVENFNFSHFFKNKIHASIEKESFDIMNCKLAVPIQSHSSNVKFITESGTYDNVDGLVTCKKYNITLSIKVADCIPLYIFDPKTQFYGLIHSGWKGTKNHIIKNALRIFFNKANSNPKDIIILIGPHIKDCCYEIDWDVAQYFSFVSENKLKNKWMLNLEKEIIKDALEIGISNKNIHTSNICTFESLNCESYRRDKKNSKRMLGILG